MIVFELNNQQIALLALLLMTLISLALGLAGFFVGSLAVSKWMQTASSLAGISSIIQLQISGLFEKWLAEYGDAEKYPYGPPSHITRQIIDNPDFPLQTAIRNTLFYDPYTGAKLGVLSLIISIVATWS